MSMTIPFLVLLCHQGYKNFGMHYMIIMMFPDSSTIVIIVIIVFTSFFSNVSVEEIGANRRCCSCTSRGNGFKMFNFVIVSYLIISIVINLIDHIVIMLYEFNRQITKLLTKSGLRDKSSFYDSIPWLQTQIRFLSW